SNIDGSETDEADINAIIRSVCNVATTDINKNCQLRLQLNDIPKIECQPGHLGQVFLNLLLNAVKAIEGKGNIDIHSSQLDRQITVTVSDNGSGMPAQVLNRIFDPFFTTNDVGDGIGLGLTVCKDIVAAHGGEISVDSEVGKGSSFTVKIPVV
ncbi:sensor histidine kinase, partial [Pseudomonadota bacterium]